MILEATAAVDRGAVLIIADHDAWHVVDSSYTANVVRFGEYSAALQWGRIFAGGDRPLRKVGVVLRAGYDGAALASAVSVVQAADGYWEELDSEGDHARMWAILRGALCSIERRRVDGAGWRWSVYWGDTMLASQPTPRAALERAMTALSLDG